MPTELRLPVGTVSAWAGTADGALLLAQDIDLRLIALPQLEVVASTCIENNIRRIAVHADGTWAALAIGSSGNYETHGNLLRLEIPSLQCDRMLDIDREVVDCSFLADGRLRFVLGARNEGERDHHEGVLLPRDAPIRVNAMAMRQLTVEETDDLQRRDEPV